VSEQTTNTEAKGDDVDPVRARIVTAALAIPAAMALGLSSSTSYRFAQERLGITNLNERFFLCATVEVAIIGLTLHAWGAKSKASAWLAYGFVAVQAVPAFEVSGGLGGIFRIAAGPVLLALLLHKLLGLEDKFSGQKSAGLLASAGREIKERITARLGIGQRGADSAAIARSRAADRAVALASKRSLGKRASVRLAVAIDAAQHGLDEAGAAAAEALIVARIVRRKSVAELHSLDERHVWSATAAATDTDTDAANGADTDGQGAGHGGGQGPATKRPRKRSNAGQDAATKTATFAAKNPDMPTGELAKKLKLSERTVRRHLASPEGAAVLIPAQQPAPGLPLVDHANGHALTA